MNIQNTLPLDFLFHPRSIAILGASSKPASKGYDYLKGILELGFSGQIYPINMRTTEILGFKTYPHIKDIPGDVDYVISCIPAQSLIDLIADCVLKGVKAIQLFTSGFSETGEPDGMILEKELVQRARNSCIRILGPNCMGLHYPDGGLAFGRAQFSKKGGTVGALFQSGGLAWNLLSSGSLRGLGFSKIISFGNASDLNESDFLEYFAEDHETKIIAVYIEGIKDGPRFVNAAKRAAKAKPLLMFKGGSSDAGKRAVASHTGSLAGSDEVWNAFFKQAGIIRAYSVDELIDLILPFEHFPQIEKCNVGVIGVGGGASVQVADELENMGLKVPPLQLEIRERIKKFTPLEGSSLVNPVDTVALWNPHHFIQTFEIMASWKGIDLMLVHAVVELTSQWQGQSVLDGIVEGVVTSKNKIGKPVVIVLQTYGTPHGAATLHKIHKRLFGCGIPVYPKVNMAANAISKFIDFYKLIR